MASELIIDVKEGEKGLYVEICCEGKLYKFARSGENHQMRCFWWEGRIDTYMKKTIDYLRPLATKALREHHTDGGGQDHGHVPVVNPTRPFREILTPSARCCIHCGYHFETGEQVPDNCPNCEETPFK